MIPKEIYEVVVDYVNGDHFITVSSTLKSWTKKIMKLHEEDPENVIIKHINDDGSIVATMPKAYLKLKKPAHRSISEEHKVKMLEGRKRSRE